MSFDYSLQTLGLMTIIGLLSYFIGSVPFGLVFTRLKGLGDIRTLGSGNIGATNVLRTGHKTLAIFTLLADLLKGTLAVVLAYFLYAPAVYVAGVCAVLGHIFPIWLRGKGGKGVATAFGVLLALNPLTAAIGGVVWFLIAKVFHYSSLSSLVSFGCMPVVAWLIHAPHLVITSLLFFLLIVVTHRGNLLRLIRGEEPKIGQKPTAD